MAWEICTEQDVRDIQTVPEIVPETWSTMVEGLVRNYTGYNKLGVAVAEYTDTKSGDNSSFMRLRNAPVDSITSVTIDSVSVGSDYIYTGEYFVQLTDGKVFTYGTRNVVVVYQAGSLIVPDDIRMAAATMIVAVANFYGRGGADQSIKWSTGDSQNAQTGEDSPSSKLGLASHLQGIMRTMITSRKVKIG